MAESPNESYLVFVGSYTDFDVLAHLPQNKQRGKGVYVFEFTNGNVTLLTHIPCLNPAVLTLHPKNDSYLYALSETIAANGFINKFDLNLLSGDSGESSDSNMSGSHGIESSVSSGDEERKVEVSDGQVIEVSGRSTCYLRFDPTCEYAISVNYWEGTIDLLSMCPDTGNAAKQIVKTHDQVKYSEKKERRQVRCREDHWVNRMVGSHAHSAHFYRDWVFVPDLGENAVYQYRWEYTDKMDGPPGYLHYETQIPLHDGAGPRHLVFHPTLPVCYVSNELDSTVTALQIDSSEPTKLKKRLIELQHLSTLPHVYSGSKWDGKNYVAEIAISQCGRHVYVSNRGNDTIACFSVDSENGKLQFESASRVFGKCPRHFALSPDGKYVLSAGQDSNNLVVMQRDAHNGSLRKIREFKQNGFNAPCFILFHPKPISKLES